MAPEVSVLIPYYSALETLPAQLDALVSQVDPPSFEIVIADNEGSDDLKRLVDKYRQRFSGIIRVVLANHERGVGPARDRAVTSAGGRLVAFCDSDDVVGPRWVGSLADAVHAQDVLATGPLRLDVLNPGPTWRAFLGVGSGVPVSRPVVLQEPFSYLGYRPFAYGCNIMCRRASYLALGGMDTRLVGGSKDVEFSWRAAEHGAPLLLVPEAVVDYRLRSTPKAIFRQKRSYMRAQVNLWESSRRMGRPVRGMLFRWTLKEILRIVPAGLRVRQQGQLQRLAFAHWAGWIAGNLEGQLRYRFLSRILPWAR